MLSFIRDLCHTKSSGRAGTALSIFLPCVAKASFGTDSVQQPQEISFATTLSLPQLQLQNDSLKEEVVSLQRKLEMTEELQKAESKYRALLSRGVVPEYLWAEGLLNMPGLIEYAEKGWPGSTRSEVWQMMLITEYSLWTSVKEATGWRTPDEAGRRIAELHRQLSAIEDLKQGCNPAAIAISGSLTDQQIGFLKCLSDYVNVPYEMV